MKKLLALLLAIAMVFACFASCGGGKDSESDSVSSGDSTSTGTSDDSSSDDTPVDSSDSGKDDKSSYTYNTAVNSLPTSWNIHTYQSNDATYILDYTEDSLYTFDYNDTRTGYQIVPAMAKEFPIDITADYVGEKWGIAAGETGKAYRINLRDDLKFDNGDAITAADFVESVKLLLNPDAANYRADSVYSGNLKIVNAENYFKQGSYGSAGGIVSEAYGDDEYIDPAKFTEGTDGVLSYNGKDVCVNITSGGNWGSNGLKKYNDYKYFASNQAAYDRLAAAADSNGLVKLTKSLLKDLQDCIAILQGCADVDEYASKTSTTKDGVSYAYVEFEEMAVWGKVYDAIDFSDVGIFVDPANANSLIIVLTQKLTGFYLKYSLTSSLYLVNVDAYKANMSVSQGVYTNTYGTAADKYVGFGPYKLTKYVDSNIVELEKNPYWYGYALPENANNYWTTKITMKQVSSAETRLNMLLAGDIDSYGLQKTDMDEYQQSKYTYYTEGDSTWFIALNPDAANLATMQSQATPVTSGNEVNKTILTIKEFRQALSFSVDRAAYELALDPTGSVAKALYGNMIISDPENGVAYRTTDEAKDVILNFWGLADEVGTTYETKDEAIAAITGYDLSGAKLLFDQAYDKAVASGLISAEAAASGKFEIQIVIGQPGSGSSAYYNDGYELLKKVWTDAVIGTKLEGKLVFTQSQPLGSTSFSDYLKNNTVDILFGVGWTGSALDPYSLMEAYVSPNYQYDPAWDTSAETLDIEYDGKVLRASVYDWGKVALGGEDINAFVVVNGEATKDTVAINGGTDADASLRLKILASVEGAVLEQYDMIPVGTQASAALKGMKIKYGSEEYVFGMGRGGIKYMTYNYTDAEWSAFVAAQGGKLNYKEAA